MQIEHLNLEQEVALEQIKEFSPIAIRINHIENNVDSTDCLIHNLQAKIEDVIDDELFVEKLKSLKTETEPSGCQLEEELREIEEKLATSNKRLLALLQSIRL